MTRWGTEEAQRLIVGLLSMNAAAPEQLAPVLAALPVPEAAAVLTLLPPQRIAACLKTLPPAVAVAVIHAYAAERQPQHDQLSRALLALADRLPTPAADGAYSAETRLAQFGAMLEAGDDALRTVAREMLEKEQPFADLADPDDLDLLHAPLLRFADLLALDDRALQQLIREFPPGVWALALSGADDALRDKVLKNVSTRAAKELREEMTRCRTVMSPRVWKTDAESAIVASPAPREARVPGANKPKTDLLAQEEIDSLLNTTGCTPACPSAENCEERLLRENPAEYWRRRIIDQVRRMEAAGEVILLRTRRI